MHGKASAVRVVSAPNASRDDENHLALPLLVGWKLCGCSGSDLQLPQSEDAVAFLGVTREVLLPRSLCRSCPHSARPAQLSVPRQDLSRHCPSVLGPCPEQSFSSWLWLSPQLPLLLCLMLTSSSFTRPSPRGGGRCLSPDCSAEPCGQAQSPGPEFTVWLTLPTSHP